MNDGGGTFSNWHAKKRDPNWPFFTGFLAKMSKNSVLLGFKNLAGDILILINEYDISDWFGGAPDLLKRSWEN